jgi:hypothetical protein
VSERRGHIKVSRRFFEEDAAWLEPRRFSKAEAWIDCIQMASWKPRRFAIGLEVEYLNRGEFMASIRFLAQRWQWGKSAVQRWIAAAQKAERLAVQREGQGGTVYLLVNYEHYQGQDRGRRDTDGDSERDTSGTPAGHLRDKSEAVKAVKHKDRLTHLTPYGPPWEAKCGVPPWGRMAKSLTPLIVSLGAECLVRWERYLAANEAKFCSPERFAATHAAYAGPETLEMTDGIGQMRLHTKRDGWWGYEDGGQWVRTIEVTKVSA